jgi:hypothetical protein
VLIVLGTGIFLAPRISEVMACVEFQKVDGDCRNPEFLDRRKQREMSMGYLNLWVSWR